MTAQEVKRKLTAILSADVKGYSRLMGENEVQTLKTLSAYFQIMTTLIQKHQGKVLNIAGDNLLADFESVMDAALCGVEIQKELRTKNAELAEGQRVEFRIGINLGDVIREGETIYGDGVNIAERVQSLADGGGICISGTAFDQVRNKLNLGYKYLGEQTVKNIVLPVRVYKVLMEPEAAGKVIGEKKAKTRQWQIATMGLVIGVIVAVAVIVIWKFYIAPAPQPEVATKEKITVAQPDKPPVTTPLLAEIPPKEKVAPTSPEKVAKPAPPPAPKMEVASKEKMAFPLPDKPSIAVLPFVNMSRDPEQENLSDGITEEIITALSKIPNLFVIARNSTFIYKGKAVKVKQVSEELGVRYVLEGSVQKSANRVRITAQLIDALAGHHLWAERYERDLKDIFALQDEITLKILTAIQVKLTGEDQSSIAEKYFKGRHGLECWLKIMEGMNYTDRFNIGDNNLARRIAEEAIVMCPEVPKAYYLMAGVHMIDYFLGSTKSPQESIEKSIEMTQRALTLNESYGEARGLLSHLYTAKREYEKAIAEGERAVALNPSDAIAIAYYATSLGFAGRSEEAIPLFQKSIRLNPFGQIWVNQNFGNALQMTERFDEAVLIYKKVIQRSPNYIWGHIMLAATYSKMGREQEARAEAEEVLRINPKFSLDWLLKTSLYKEQLVKENMVNALRKAGLK